MYLRNCFDAKSIAVHVATLSTQNNMAILKSNHIEIRHALCYRMSRFLTEYLECRRTYLERTEVAILRPLGRFCGGVVQLSSDAPKIAETTQTWLEWRPATEYAHSRRRFLWRIVSWNTSKADITIDRFTPPDTCHSLHRSLFKLATWTPRWWQQLYHLHFVDVETLLRFSCHSK